MIEIGTSLKDSQKADPHNELLRQIDEFPSIEMWWRDKIFLPAFKNFVPQFLALLLLNIAIIYTHNWLAAFLCFVLNITRMYRMIVMLSMNMVHAQLICQIRAAFIKGVEVGESKVSQQENFIV